MAAANIKRIGFLAYDGVQGLDLFGPQEVFAEAATCGAKPNSPAYETLVISKSGKAVVTESGVSIGAHVSFENCPPLHTLIIPGGAGSRSVSDDTIHWILANTRCAKRVGSVCTGLFILARTGVLRGFEVTTHWHHVEEAQLCFPDLRMNPDALFIRQGKYFTAAGVTAGIDMALALVEEDLGSSIASEIARHFVVFLRRPGGQKQFSSILKQQSRSNDQFADLIAWIADNLSQDLSTTTLAERACLSERHFRRAFKQTQGMTPSQLVEELRMDVAKERLAATDIAIDDVSRSVGFGSPDSFRRAFERATGINPSAYRTRFGKPADLAKQGIKLTNKSRKNHR